MFHSSIATLTKGSRRRIMAGALTATLVTPSVSLAFFQQTKLEGGVGTDIGGVWLSIQHQMPEFRISYPKPPNGPAAPFEVGPLGSDVEPLTGKNAPGVAITKCIDAGFCNDNGILVGDIVIAINSNPMTDVASFEAALANPAPTILLSMRRPALAMSTTRLFKIQYKSTAKEVEGASEAAEQVDVQLLDVALPFADEVEKSRQAHVLFKPSEAQSEALAKNWFELPISKPMVFIKGSHRFVAQAAFDESLASDKSLAKSKFAMLLNMQGNPTKGGGGQIVDVYGIESMEAKKMTGNYVSVTMASAPFPIHIEFKGRFEMTRIADWSDEDEKARAANVKPLEDLNKFKTMPDVPAPAKPETKTN